MDMKGQIVFSSGKQGDYDIWKLNLDSQELKQLTVGDYWNDSPKWSPDGNNIIFVSNKSGFPEIWMMDKEGNNQRQITETKRYHATPSWSPDGKNIVFCANYDGNLDIYSMALDGTNLEKITESIEMDSKPVFSPDGKNIAYTSRQSGNSDIWLYSLTDKTHSQLTTHPEDDYSPAYSPDGEKIAFVSGRFNDGRDSNLEIFLMNVDGSDKQRITHNRGIDRFVTWSRDGRYLIYSSSERNSLAERLSVLDVVTMRKKKINYDRSSLESEIEAEVKSIGIFSLLPEVIVRKFYNESYFGSERYPDWFV